MESIFKTVPFSPSHEELSRDENERIMLMYYRYGFYYDSVDRDFRIIAIWRCEKKSELGKEGYILSELGKEGYILVLVYSCKLDTWREIKVDSLPNSKFYIAGIFNGRVYVHFYSKPGVLVAFDVHDEVFKRLPCPEQYIEVEDTKHRPYINWQDSLGIVAYKEPNDPEAVYDKKIVYIYDEATSTWIEKYEKAVYIYDEATCTWIEKYTAPDALDSHRILHGSKNGDIVVEEKRIMDSYYLLRGLYIGDVVKGNTGIVKLFEAESSQFNNLTNVSASDIDVRGYTESLVCIKGMQPL